MRCTVIHRRLGIARSHQAVDQSGSEGVSAADAVIDLKPVILLCLVDLAAGPAECAPVIHRCGFDGAECRRDHLEVRVGLGSLVDHLFVTLDVQGLEVGVVAFHFEAQAGCEVFLVADHHVDIFCNFPVDFLCLFLSADGAPHGGAVVEVVGDNGAVLFGSLDAFHNRLAGLFGKCCINAAGMQPAHTALTEYAVKIEVGRGRLGDRRICTVRAADCAADAEPSLGEVQAVAADSADAVRRHPFDKGSVHAALQDEVLHQLADLVVGESGQHGGLQAEAAPQPADNVVFSAALPGLELAGRADPAVTRIEPEHHFADGNGVKSAFFSRAQIEFYHSQVPPISKYKIKFSKDDNNLILPVFRNLSMRPNKKQTTESTVVCQKYGLNYRGLLAHVHLGCNFCCEVLFLLLNAFALDEVHGIDELYAAAELLGCIGNVLLNGTGEEVAADKLHLEQAVVFVELVDLAGCDLLLDGCGLCCHLRVVVHQGNLNLELVVDVGLRYEGLVPVLRVHSGNLHGDVLADFGCVDVTLNSEVDQNGAGTACMDVGDVGAFCKAGKAADLKIFTDGHDLLGENLLNCQFAAGILACLEGIHVCRVVGEDDFADVLHKCLEEVALGAEVGLAVDFNDCADAALGADMCISHTFGSNAACLLGGLCKALFTQPVDCLVHIAVGSLESLFAVHHADVGHLS